MTNPQVVLFDFEGVLVDGRPYWRSLSPEVLQRAIPHWNVEHQRALYGRSLGDVYEILSRDHGLSRSRAEFLQLYSEVVENIYGRQVEPTVGCRECLTALTKRGWKLGVVSSVPRNWFERALKRLQLLEFFSVRIGLEEVEWRVKPLPDGYLLACKEFQTLPRDAVVVEDSLRGVKSALNAGIRRVILLGDELSKEISDPVIRAATLHDVTSDLIDSAIE